MSNNALRGLTLIKMIASRFAGTESVHSNGRAT